MKFRHKEGKRLSLTTGHVAHVGTDWTDLHPRFREAAMKAGCEVDLQTIPDLRHESDPPPPSRTLQSDETVSILRTALIRMIERGSADDFTASGLPNLNTLRKEAGIDVEKALAYEIFAALTAEAGDA